MILTRDEMANMVWGVADIIPGIADGGVNGFEAAVDLERYLREQVQITPEPTEQNYMRSVLPLMG